MNPLISGALFLILALAAIRNGSAAPSDAVPPVLGQDTDTHVFQRALEGQQRTLDALDAILSATGLLLFTAMTYLLAIDSIRTGMLAPRAIAVALLVPIALTVYGVVAFEASDAPDISRFARSLQTDRAGAYADAQAAMVEAFKANRLAIAAKKRFRSWAFASGALLFGIDLLGFVVQWRP